VAVGSALGALAIGLLGVDGALLLVGASLAVLALLTGRPLARSEASVPIVVSADTYETPARDVLSEREPGVRGDACFPRAER
jgi:hypothetical protein